MRSYCSEHAVAGLEILSVASKLCWECCNVKVQCAEDCELCVVLKDGFGEGWLELVL